MSFHLSDPGHEIESLQIFINLFKGRCELTHHQPTEKQPSLHWRTATLRPKAARDHPNPNWWRFLTVLVGESERGDYITLRRRWRHRRSSQCSSEQKFEESAAHRPARVSVRWPEQLSGINLDTRKAKRGPAGRTRLNVNQLLTMTEKKKCRTSHSPHCFPNTSSGIFFSRFHPMFCEMRPYKRCVSPREVLQCAALAVFAAYADSPATEGCWNGTIIKSSLVNFVL